MGTSPSWIAMMDYSAHSVGASIAVTVLRDPLKASDADVSSSRQVDPLVALTHKAAEGCDESLEVLLLEVTGPMLRTVRKVLGAHHPNVEDVAQEAAMAFSKALQGFRGESSVKHFATRVALRTALHVRRHLGVRARIGDYSVSEADGEDLNSETPLQILVAEERRRILREVLGQLSPVIADAVAMHFMLGMTVNEIAESEGVSANTVWSRLRLGKDSLRKALAEDGRLGKLQNRGVS